MRAAVNARICILLVCNTCAFVGPGRKRRPRLTMKKAKSGR